jgi:hypothetical protein
MSLPDVVRALPIYFASLHPKVTGIELMPIAAGKYSKERFTWAPASKDRLQREQAVGRVSCFKRGFPKS